MHLHKDTFVMQPSFGWTPLYDSGYFISSYFTASGGGVSLSIWGFVSHSAQVLRKHLTPYKFTPTWIMQSLWPSAPPLLTPAPQLAHWALYNPEVLNELLYCWLHTRDALDWLCPSHFGQEKQGEFLLFSLNVISTAHLGQESTISGI